MLLQQKRMKTKAAVAALMLVCLSSNAQTQSGSTMTLDRLFSLVEASSKSLAVSKTGIEIADKGIDAAKSKRLPDINTSLSFSYIGNALLTDRDFSNAQGLSSPHFGNSFTLEAQQAVYTGGALSAGIDMARLQREQAENSVSLSRQQARFIALGQYLDLFKTDNRIKVYEQNIALTRQLIADISEKQQQGMALKNDITRYELQMETLKLGLTALQNNRSILNHQLCNTLGLSQEEHISPDTTIVGAAYATDGEDYWQSRSLLTSPLLRQSALNVSLAEQRERLAKSDLLPKVAIVAANNFNGPITFELPPIDKNLNIWYVGVGISYNLSSLFKSNHRVRQTAIETRQMREARALLAEQTDNQVQEAYTRYRQTYVELATQQKSVQLAVQNYNVMNARYMSQLALVTDMVDASNLRLNAELQEVDARINIIYAYYRMKYIAGEL